eukprot:UC1_evm2s657
MWLPHYTSVASSVHLIPSTSSARTSIIIINYKFKATTANINAGPPTPHTPTPQSMQAMADASMQTVEKAGHKRKRSDPQSPDAKRSKHQYGQNRNGKWSKFQYGQCKSVADMLNAIFPKGHSPMRFLVYHAAITMAALYPPAKSAVDKQHANRTSSDLFHELLHLNFDWVDLFAHMSNGTNSDVEQGKMRTFVENGFCTDMIKDWIERILDNKSRIVYVAGTTCNIAWQLAEEADLFKGYEVTKNIAPGVDKYYNDERSFFVLLERPHPSAHLVAGGRPEARKAFDDACATISCLYDMPSKTSDVGKYMHDHLPQEIRLREVSLCNLNKALAFTGMRNVTRCHSLYSVWRRFDGDAEAFVGAYKKVVLTAGGTSCDGLYAAWGRQPDLEEFLKELKRVIKKSGGKPCDGLYAAWGRQDDFKVFLKQLKRVIKASGKKPCGGLYAAWGRQKNLKVFLKQLKRVIKASGKKPCNGLYAAWGRHKDGDFDTFCDSVGLVALAARGSQSNQLYSAWAWRQKNKASAEVFAGEVHKIVEAANAVHVVLFTRWKTSQLGCDEFCEKISLVRDDTGKNTLKVFTDELCRKRK